MEFLSGGTVRLGATLTMCRTVWHRGLLGLALLVWTAGCATTDSRPHTDEERESDIPWNTPQPWEGTLGIPGFSPGD